MAFASSVKRRRPILRLRLLRSIIDVQMRSRFGFPQAAAFSRVRPINSSTRAIAVFQVLSARAGTEASAQWFEDEIGFGYLSPFKFGVTDWHDSTVYGKPALAVFSSTHLSGITRSAIRWTSSVTIDIIPQWTGIGP